MAATSDGEIGDKGDSLAPVKSHRHPVALDARRAKQIQCKGGLHSTSFLISVLELREKVNRSRFSLDSGVK